MPDRHLRTALRDFDFTEAFVEIGWDRLDRRVPGVEVDGHLFTVEPVAEKKGAQVFAIGPSADGLIPSRGVRRRIDRAVRAYAEERLLVFADRARTKQVWLWVDRAPGKAPSFREHEWHTSQDPEGLVQKLSVLATGLDEEDTLTVVDMASRMEQAFDKEKVTKQFYRAFDRHRQDFLGQISGIPDDDLREWYASALLNRLMFVYFLQKKGFLEDDRNYLQNRLALCRQRFGDDEFYSFYRSFLLRLFHEGLNEPESRRDAEIEALIGKNVPYLNGGLFQIHEVERDHDAIAVPDEAFTALFDFFDGWDWTLDYRPLRTGNEINPDVLGYLFEQYINNKQMGAYYTKEDVTGYITRNTLVPFVLDDARRRHPAGFEGDGSVWRLLREEPDAYVYPAVQHTARDADGRPRPLPDEIAAGVEDVARRDAWNALAPAEWGLPTEIWRETVARRQRYLDLRDTLAAGEVQTAADLVSLNLDVEAFAEDAIKTCESPDLLRAFRDALRSVSVLDPTCGSGAFLFAALERLETLYTACLQRMETLVAQLDADSSASKRQLADFRDEIAEARNTAKHPNLTYFVLKRILLDNLYGVDIMPEAVEICKLRLFLKLAAQVEPGGRLEPLPDIDFNIRAGNALVGYAGRAEVERGLTATRVAGGADQGRLAFDEEKGALAQFEEKLADVAALAERFREQQQTHGGEVTAADKDALRDRLGALTEALDRALAVAYGVDPDDEAAFETWRASHQPFHWFAEFYGVMADGGFDVVVGNPPYISARKIDYEIQGPSYPDIYASVSHRLFDLTHDRSTLGLIVPLSLAFSGRYSDLRKAMRENGRNWFSSYDNIPAALFYGVSQRCTIWVGHRGGADDVETAPMYRWRSEYRPQLLQTLAYAHLDGPLAAIENGIPKLATGAQAEVAERVGRTAYAATDGSEAIGYSQAARNFVSVFLEAPPVLDADSLAPVDPSKVGFLDMGEGDAPAALAALAGEFYLWDWLVRGDGFDVTQWMVAEYLGSVLPAVMGPSRDLLRGLGRLLWTRRNEALQFKKNAGKYVGNYNWLHLTEVTRRADLLVMAALGLDADRAQHVLDYVTRVLSINVFAGEKNIPTSVRALFPPASAPGQEDLLRRSDAAIQDHFGWTDAQLAALINEHVAADA